MSKIRFKIFQKFYEIYENIKLENFIAHLFV